MPLTRLVMRAIDPEGLERSEEPFNLKAWEECHSPSRLGKNAIHLQGLEMREVPMPPRLRRSAFTFKARRNAIHPQGWEKRDVPINHPQGLGGVSYTLKAWEECN